MLREDGSGILERERAADHFRNVIKSRDKLASIDAYQLSGRRKELRKSKRARLGRVDR